MRSASRLSRRPRSEAFIFGQGPSSNALRAALTARSTSALSPSATWQMVSPVAGLIVGKVLPDTLSSHLPPMKSGGSLTLGGFTVGFALVAVAVAMASLQCMLLGEAGWLRAHPETGGVGARVTGMS